MVAISRPTVFCAALAPDGEHVVIGTGDSTVQRLRVGRGAALPLVFPREFLPSIPAPFLPDSPTRLLWMKRDRARVLDVASAREVAGGFVYPEPVGRTGYLDWDSPARADMRFMVMRTSQGFQAWELGPGEVIRVAILADSIDAAGPVRFSPRGDLVALRFSRNPSEKARRIAVWNLRTGARVGLEFSYPFELADLSPTFSPDGTRLALGTKDGACMIIDIATARPVVTFATRPLVPNVAVWFSPDGTRVFTSNHRNETRAWNPETGEAISPVLSSEHWWGGARYLPNGRWFATWGVHSTSLWDGQTGASVGETIPAGGRMVCFSRDSRSVGTADDRGIAQVWDVPSGQPFTEPMRYKPKQRGRFGIPEFSPDGRFMRALRPHEFYVFSVPPRLPEGTPVPEWLLQLATVLSTKTVNDTGQLVDLPDAMTQFHDVVRQIAALPANAPLADWCRWILDTRADRPIAPGFTCTAADAEKLAAALAAELTAKP